MTLTRRKTLALIGGGTILAAGAAGAGFLTTRTPTSALRPWDLAGQYDDPRLNALSYGLLAPNPHNLQPWMVGLEGEDGLTIWGDPSKGLPETDPYDRQIMIGFGCFIEQMVLAAGAAGWDTEVTLFPDGEAGPVAAARLKPGGTADPLAAHMLERRSCKEPFANRPVPAKMADELRTMADIYTDPAEVAQIKQLTWDAWMVETTTRRTMKESVDLMRFGRAEIEANPDGIDLGGPFLESLMLVGVVGRAVQLDPESRGFQEGVRIYDEMLHATPAYAVITTPGNSRAEQIATGRRWLRLNLRTTALGLSLHPVSQALQEFPEMAPHYARAHDLMAPEGGVVQLLGRLGYGPATPRTPRWPLEEKLIAA